MAIFIKCHRSGLIYDKNRTPQNYFGMRGRGLPHWRVPPLEMLSTCTCYSQLHWRWFGYVSPSYCTTWPSLVLACFRFLLDHVLCCGHVSFLHWTMWHIFIGPCGRFLFNHVSWHCPSTLYIFIRPCGLTISFHVSDS